MCVCVVRVTVPRQFLNIAKERYNIVYRKTRYIHLSFDSKRGYIRRRKSRRSIKSNSLSTCENFFFFLSFFFFFSSKISRSFYFRPVSTRFIANEIFSRNFQYTRRGGLREQRMEKNLNGELKVLCDTRFSTSSWKFSIISIQKFHYFRQKFKI